MYNKIEIYKTDFTNKYLLKLNDNTLYVGYIVKEVILLLKSNIKEENIPNIINNKFNLKVNDDDIQKIIKNIDKNLFIKKNTSLIKLIKIINPNKISVPEFLQNMFEKKTFYLYLTLTLLTNIYGFIKVERVISKSFIEIILLYIILAFVLILHELGHSIASKKYGVATNEIGFGFYSIFPVFYINLSEVWRLSTVKRIIINLSGILYQLLIGFFLVLINIFFEKNYYITNLIYINFVIILLNLNPFFKFDGYWVISDILKQNNLMNKSNELLKGLLSLKLPKEKLSMILYIFLKLIFILWVIYNILTFIFKYTLKLLNNEFSNLNFIILTIILGLIITQLIKKNYELNKRKKTI